MIHATVLPTRVLAVLAVASIAFVPQAALAGGCAPEGTTAAASGSSLTMSDGRALSAVPDALTIAARMDRNPYVFMNSAELAGSYSGCGDDSSRQFGRMVVSYGSPPRVIPARQTEYNRAVRSFRQLHPEARNDVDRVVRYLTRRGMLMRDPQVEDSRGQRLGRASTIPGAVSMATTGTADVIVFSGRAAAQTYLENADDNAYRYGAVVLSYGAPARVIPSQREVYQRVLRRVLG